MLEYKIFEKGIALLELNITEKFNNETKAFYYKLLKDIDNEVFISGLEKLIRDRVYTNKPTIAEIRKFCIGTSEEKLKLKILDAKEKIRTSMRCFSGVNIVFDDPVLHLIIKKMGGLDRIGNLTVENFDNFLNFQFDELYKIYFNNINEYLSEIPKFAKYHKNNVETEFIGDTLKAKNWLENHNINIKKLK